MTVFIARHFPPLRFAAISGITLSLGGIGMLATGTPLAWLIEAASWRMGFAVLGGMAALAWLLIWKLVHEPGAEASVATGQAREPFREAIGKFGALFLMPHTLGIMLWSRLLPCYPASPHCWSRVRRLIAYCPSQRAGSKLFGF